MRGSSKSQFNDIFHCNGQERNIRKVGNLFQPKNHIAMQNTPPKQEKNIVSMAHKTENQPFLPQFYTIFRTTHEHIFIRDSI